MKVVIWSKSQCVHCDQAKALMTQRGIAFEERKIGDGYILEQLLAAVPSARTVPQIFLNDELVGGLAEFKRLLEQWDGQGYGDGEL